MRMVFRRYAFECELLNDQNERKIAYKCDIGMVSDQCECECVALIHRIVRNVDHNSLPDMRTVVHEPAFCSADLDIYVVSLAPISMGNYFVGRPAKEFHVLYLLMDCIQLIEHCMIRIAFHVIEPAAVAAEPVAVNVNPMSSSSM